MTGDLIAIAATIIVVACGISMIRIQRGTSDDPATEGESTTRRDPPQETVTPGPSETVTPGPRPFTIRRPANAKQRAEMKHAAAFGGYSNPGVERSSTAAIKGPKHKSELPPGSKEIAAHQPRRVNGL